MVAAPVLKRGMLVKLICTKAEPASTKVEFDFAAHYIKGFIRNLQTFIDSVNTDRDALKRSVFYGVKCVAGNRKASDPQRMFCFAAGVKLAMMEITPAELITIFPIIKTYDGDRTESKDYFYSIDRLKEHGLHTIIGDAVDNLLWNIRNRDLELFTVRCMTLADEVRRMEGKPGMIEEFFGIQPKYLRKDERGKEFMFDPATGKTAKVKSKRRLHLVAKKGNH